MNRPLLSRRALLASTLAAAACTKPKAQRFLGYCFVANHDGRNVAAIDLTRFRTRQRIALDAAPTQILARPKETKAYVLTPTTGTVHEIDANDLTLPRRIRAGNTALSMRLARDGKSLWVLYRDPSQLVEIPFESLRPARRVKLPAAADDFDLSREADVACVLSSAARSISVVSLEHSAIDRVIQAPVAPGLARFRSDGAQIIAGTPGDKSLTIYDTASGKTVVRLPLSITPRQFCFDSGGGHLYVSGEGMDAVVSVYPYRTEIAETLAAGHAPGAMTISESERPPAYLMVANPESDRVTVLDVETGILVAVVEVGRGPRQIVVTPDNAYALVLNERSGDVAVIRIYSLGGNQVGGQRVRHYKSAGIFTMIPVGERPVSAAVVALS